MEQEECAEWLQRVLTEEIDVRPPKSNVKREEAYLQRCAHVTLYGEKRPAGHCELRRCGGGIELCTIIVDSEKRGIGLSHELIRLSLSRAAQDPIVSGNPLGGHEPPLIFSFTRSAALATSLTKAGFKIQPAKRRLCRLFLWKSASANLPLRIQLGLFRERLGRLLIMIFRERKKFKQQIIRVGDYHLFTRIAGAPKPNDEPLTTEGVFALGMNVVRVTDKDLKNEDDDFLVSTARTKSWDDGEE